MRSAPVTVYSYSSYVHVVLYTSVRLRDYDEAIITMYNAYRHYITSVQYWRINLISRFVQCIVICNSLTICVHSQCMSYRITDIAYIQQKC